MADHRVTDLSYGHLGKASYDTDEKEWKFSVNLNKRSSIQQLTPSKEWLAPSIRKIPPSEKVQSLEIRSQRKWLAKSHPELVPADILATDLSQVDLSREKDVPVHIGSLLTVARAVDTDRISGSRTTQILAVPYGDAGHILRLMRPSVEVRGWAKNSAARLTLLHSDSPEYGYWIGEGGVIRQILASDTDNGSGTWLAVRQDSATTIFRPQYGRLHDASAILNAYPEVFPISQLHPNPVATLKVDQTQSRAHADVAFNPWYARQFAVVDTSGLWSIWDLDVPHGINMKAKLVLRSGKRGSIYDGCMPEDPLRMPEDAGHFDGWHKILWICNIGTILLCNRRHITLVDFAAGKSHLQTVDIIPLKSQDWILDIKRSVQSNKDFFVLTTSRIFWVKVVLDEGIEDIPSSALRVILSYRHFRNLDDESMRLVVLPDTSVSVLIVSSSSPHVQFYCFDEGSDSYDIPASYQGSFTLRQDKQQNLGEDALSNICFLACQLTQSESLMSGSAGLQYIEKDVRFFQVWTLNVNLGLNSSIFSIHDQSTKDEAEVVSVATPTTIMRRARRRIGKKVMMADSFIVADGEQDEDDIEYIARENMQYNMQATLDESQDDSRFRIDWRRIYRYAFGLDSGHKQPTSEDLPSIRDLLARVSEQIQQGLENNELSASTLTEISGFEAVFEDTEGASRALQDFLQSLEREPDSQSLSELIVSNVIHSSELRGVINESGYPDVWSLYDRLADYWMASLPPDLTDIGRVARHRVVQQLAMDICLSSISISVENKLVTVEDPPHKETESMSLPIMSRNSAFSRDSSPALFSSQLAAISSQEARVLLPTPSMTPSVYSHTTSGSEVKEHPAITRLRQYARSIKAKPDLGQPSVLSHWPSRPGADPARYSYPEAQKALLAAESGDESEHRNGKEVARRRRRTEKFLRQEQSRAVEKAAKSQFLPSGSQPAVSNELTSSQTVPDVPMTQPVFGTFGSRKGEREKRKSKKKRKAGFR